MSDTEARVRAPDFDGAVDWFNVPGPLSLKQLRGKVVLLDFWTYGCVNCMHVLPGLKHLGHKYRDELIVVGIHSAKFTNERRSENIRRVLVRYDVDHPVANDAEFRIWHAYGARAWPTQVLIDPEGYVVAAGSGEGRMDAFDKAIAAVVEVFGQQGQIDRTPLRLSLERERIQASTLAFPGKVLADEATGRLFIADSNHHRVMVTTLAGEVVEVIGDGQPGFVDGAFEGVRMYRPQGMALDGDRLLVADTENHAVRAANLTTRRVTTVAGMGRQAGYGEQGGAARETPLNSPWDLLLHGRLLFVAMAGSHQIWIVDLERSLAIPYAGSGREARADGAVDAAAFAQPSGLTRLGDNLVVADSESNIIRSISLPPGNEVTTLAGGDLFEFGDFDGRGAAVRLQHPLGVAAARDRVFIADTYNHRIKSIDPASGDVRVFAGTGQQGKADGSASRATFDEPGGLSVASDTLFVADTNNHAIRRVSLVDGSVSTLPVG